MKKILMLCLALCCSVISMAQFKTIADSPVFTEPEDGLARILQLKNGSTMFFVLTVKKGIEFKLYDPKHKLKVNKTLNPRYGKLKAGQVEAIFEANGDAVLLISEVDERRPMLYRLIIDGVKGVIKKEETIGELPRVKMGGGYAMAFGNVPPPAYFAYKDPSSDLYAVALFNSFASERNERLEVALYNGRHEEIGRAFFTSPEDKFKYIEYVDMTIVDESVYVLGYAFNTAASGGKENTLLMGALSKGGSKVALKELDFAQDKTLDRGVLKYNPATRKLMLLTYVTNRRSRKTGNTRLIEINPQTSEVTGSNDIFPTEAEEKSKELFGKRADLEVRPVNFFINPDGSWAVVYEEIKVTSRSYNTAPATGSVGGSVSFSPTVVNTELNDMAVSLYNVDGKVNKSYFIPKRHFLLSMQPRSFYHSNREGRAAYLKSGDQFKSFAYINGKEKMYVLFNDVEENIERVPKGKITTIKGVSECDAFAFGLEGENTMPDRAFLFGKPSRKKDHNLVLFAVSDYDRDRNVYVTVRLSVKGNDKTVQLVWMEPS
ncbi:hypothetical protein ACWKWU_21220 [Chitinophaga lutea]